MHVFYMLHTGAFALSFGLLATSPAPAAPRPSDLVTANDNTRPAGRLDGARLTLDLRAAEGEWRPEGPQGPSLSIDAFGEEGGALSVPAPLIRVAEGTTVAASIRNELAAPLRVHGLCARDGSACVPLDVPPGEQRRVRFVAGHAGTYHYWATTIGAPVPFRELAGALIVDPAGAPPAPDRIFVVTEWTSLTLAQIGRIMTAEVASEAFVAERPRLTFVINGLSWPATERLTYRQGEAVRWRVINLSSQAHPMHLHGFYFRVLRRGDGRSDEPVAAGEGRLVVTQVLPSSGTMLLEWTPEREGNWLFHCHIMHHVSPERRLADDDEAAAPAHAPHAHQPDHPADRGLGMAGMVLGITVLPASVPPASSGASGDAPRRLTLVIRPRSAAAGGGPAGFVLSEAGAAAQDATAEAPGPVLVLRRGEPAEITVVNQLADATAIHWHGLELESYYDGVHGWSGAGRRVAPMIAPGASFVVRITPPRAGTFIYHTHLHDYRQLTSGLYGPIVVTEPGEAYDPAVDHVLVLARHGGTDVSGILEDPASAVINGAREPRWVWAAGRRHRVRIINITPDDLLNVSLSTRSGAAASWRPLAKDGAAVPAVEAGLGPSQVQVAVGETYDFEYDTPPAPTTLWLEVRAGSGRWQSQGRVLVR
jgi:FtsP/CotA-like multicopper oxidase with cupredoxin domain